MARFITLEEQIVKEIIVETKEHGRDIFNNNKSLIHYEFLDGFFRISLRDKENPCIYKFVKVYNLTELEEVSIRYD